MEKLRRKRLGKRCVLLALLIACAFSARPGLMEGNGMPYLRYAVCEADPWETPLRPTEFESGLSEEAQIEAFERWWSAREARSRLSIPQVDQIHAFSRKSVRAFLEEENSGNFIYSPVSLWLFANMLTDLSAGETRAQLLALLGCDDDAARLEQLEAVWKSLCWDDGSLASVPAASLWLNGRVEIADDALKALNTRHNASVYRGRMGDPDYDAALRAWIDEKTRDLLSGTVSELRFEPDSGISACSTFYFRAMWESTFDADETFPEVFHGSDGPVDADFMHACEKGTVYRGEDFSAYLKPFRDGGCAALILPEEGASPEALLRSDEVFRFLSEGDRWAQGTSGMVNLSVPKLDLTAGFSLESGLRELGVTEIFDTEAADFEGRLSSDAPFALSSPRQLCRLVMDEEGVEAAAITISDVFGAMAMPEEEIDFALDRPFILAFMDDRRLPLFMGLVRQP